MKPLDRVGLTKEGSEYFRMVHSIKRCKERYGVTICPREYYEICKLCLESTPLMQLDFHISYYRICYKGIYFNVIFSHKHNNIRTFLPQKCYQLDSILEDYKHD